MEPTQFKENLKTALSAGNMTQKKLADHLRTTQATISRWIKGINEPDLATLIEICIFLGETPNSILEFDEIESKARNYDQRSYENKDTISYNNK